MEDNQDQSVGQPRETSVTASEQAEQPQDQGEITNRYTSEAQLIQEVRQQALGENPTPEATDAFNNSTQGLSLSILERFYRLRETAGTLPIEGNARNFNLKYGSLGLDVQRKFVIYLDSKQQSKSEAGRIRIKGPFNGGDDVLLYNPKVSGVDIDIKTGNITYGEEAVTPETKGRIDSMLQLTRAYYTAAEQTAPRALQLTKAFPSTETIMPRFPSAAITQIRKA